MRKGFSVVSVIRPELEESVLVKVVDLPGACWTLPSSLLFLSGV